jgi:FkbM family methyltransferase
MEFFNNLLFKFLERTKLIRKINFTFKIKNNGVTFKIPVIFGTGLSYLFKYEPWQDIIFKSVLDSETNFIDIGANIGQSLIKAKSISSSINYIGFEPNPHCVSYLHHLIQSNYFINTIIFPVGISNSNSLQKLSIENETASSASVIPKFRKGDENWKSIFVPLLDYKNLPVLPLGKLVIRIDVEGAELEIIESLKNYIEQNKPIIVCEILPVYSIENSERLNRQTKIEAIFKSLNYKIKRIHSNGILEEIQNIGIHTDLSSSNYLLEYNHALKGKDIR